MWKDKGMMFSKKHTEVMHGEFVYKLAWQIILRQRKKCSQFLNLKAHRGDAW